MKLATTSMIPQIDRYCNEKLHISLIDLIDRSGRAVARVVRSKTKAGGTVVILAGRGNNGADGYAAAVHLLGEYRVTVYDVLDAGQNSEEGKHYLKTYLSAGGEVRTLEDFETEVRRIRSADCIVDAMFGTGFRGEIPPTIKKLANAVRVATHAQKIAVDVPLGVNADDGSITPDAMYVGTTVELSFVKCGIVSYPGRGYAGNIVFDDLELPRDEICDVFDFRYHLIEKKWVEKNMPERPENSNKGTFGKVMLLSGCEIYRGAAALSLEGALRGGAGMIRYYGIASLCEELRAKFPEVIYQTVPPTEEMTEADRDHLVEESKKADAILIGPGSGNSEALAKTVCRLLATEGCPMILDADAINCLTWDPEEGLKALENAKRKVVLTPHPMEFSRLCGIPVTDVQEHRIEVAKTFAEKMKVTVVLKGAGTVVTDGDQLFINHTGSSALAKAGSGDVLAGFIASLVAGKTEPLVASALGVYFHGKAADSLAKEFSTFGVTPSDLPRQMAREIANFQTQQEEI